MQQIDHVINFASSILERFPPQIYTTVLFAVCCSLGLAGVVVSRKRSAYLQGQIDELRRKISLLESEEGRRTVEFINSQVHQEDASPLAPFSVITMPAPLAPTSHDEPR